MKRTTLINEEKGIYWGKFTSSSTSKCPHLTIHLAPSNIDFYQITHYYP